MCWSKRRFLEEEKRQLLPVEGVDGHRSGTSPRCAGSAGVPVWVWRGVRSATRAYVLIVSVCCRNAFSIEKILVGACACGSKKGE